MTNILDKRISVEGAETDDIVYGDKGQILKPIAPKNYKEEKQLDEMMKKHPNLDYLMCLLLIQAKEEELEEIIKNAKPRQLDTSTIIKQDFYINEEPNLNNLVIS